MKMANNAQQVTTGKVRLSYVHVFKPYAHQPGQDEKYSTTILVPKSDVATKMRIDAAIQAATQVGIAEKWSGVKPPILAIPIYDGDGARPSDGMPFGEECKGHWVFTASSKQPVAVVDVGLNPMINQTEMYSGVYARVNVSFYPYNSNGKKGIGCGLGPIQKLEDGEPLGGTVSAEQAFGGANAFPSNYGQQPTYQQQPVYQQPVYQQQPQQPMYQPQPQQQQMYQQPQQQQMYQPQFDPITGAPIVPGGVMGI